ncbi:MAG: hypothetical protein V7K88_23560 [Nostoc sp.]|uniref:hypothetical protein n=1 Tax=Nostoc sp. TaxID=1180 RepID=UPI002FF5E055
MSRRCLTISVYASSSIIYSIFWWLRFQTALVGTNQRSLFPHPPIPVAISRPKYFTGAIGEGII